MIPYVNGFPKKMAIALQRLPFNTKRSLIICSVQSERDRLPIEATEAVIRNCGIELAREVYVYIERYKNNQLVIDAIALLARRVGVDMPLGETEAEQISRAVDKNWWIRALRKEHARRFEHVSIQLGFTSYKTGIYLSDESAIRQRQRNKDNAELLKKVELQNELGQIYTLDELASLGVADKAIRRGELMTRIRGFEEIAKDVGDVGMFWTITCPSKYHAVLSKSGEMNPAYKDATPREAQAYLCKVWSRIRAALKRSGIQPYGFRIAEPHHDGCPHWHMLLFVKKDQAKTMEGIVRKYALAQDGDEPGAQANRVKLVNIEAGKGTAAGYIAKYVAKNIDGAHVGEHKTSQGWTVTHDMLGNEEITPSQRVCLWAQLWGIRQFQQIGGAPVTVWRELRRVKYEQVLNAPEEIKSAWGAVQKHGIEPEAQASWAQYVKAQGGATVGRNALIRIATKETEIAGKYGIYFAQKPCGVYSLRNINAVYESTRYQWTKIEKCGGGNSRPWTGVNNCTRFTPDEDFAEWKKQLKQTVKENENRIFSRVSVDEWMKNWRMRD